MSGGKKSSKGTPQSRSKANDRPPKVDVKVLWNLPPWEWPKNAAQALLLLLRDREAPEEDRRMAVNLVSELCDDFEEPFSACLEILASPAESEALRCAAAITLGPTLEQMDYLVEPDSEEPEVDPEEPWVSPALFEKAKATLHDLWQSPELPKTLRRKVLESSVRSPQEWHPEAIRTAYSTDDTDWKLSAVFAMRYVRGFDAEILEALKHPDPDVHCEAVRAAGEWGLEKAWPHIRSILTKAPKDKNLLLAAIDAAPNLSSSEASEILGPYLGSKDEDIVEAAMEAFSMLDGEGLDDDFDDDEWEDHFFKEEDEGDDPEPPKGKVIPFRH